MGDHDLLTVIEAKERAVWQALLDGDAIADTALLSQDFLGVYPSGFSDRDGHAGQLSHGPAMQDYRLSEVQVRQYADDLALIAYRATYLAAGAETWSTMLISSIWRRDGVGWINIFSQDTPVD